MPVFSSSLNLRLLYMTCFGIYGVILPFSPLILKEQGLPDGQISLVLSAFGLAALVSPILISHIADRRLPINKLLPILAFCAFLFAPLWVMTNSLASGVLACFLFYSAMIPTMTLLDAFTVNLALKEKLVNPQARGFQSYRVWGSVGFMIPSLLLIPLSKFFAITSVVLVVCIMILSFLSFVLAKLLPVNIPFEQVAKPPLREAISLALKPPLFGVLAATTAAGLSLSIFYFVYSRFLQELGHSIEHVGFIINLGVFFEILLIPFAGKLIDRFGARRLVLLGLWSIPIRLLLVITWPSTWMVLSTQWLHAPLVVGLFVAVPILLGQAAGDSFRYSLQSLNTALVLGISRLIGPWLAAPVLMQVENSVFVNLKLALLLAAGQGAAAFLILLWAGNRKNEIV